MFSFACYSTPIEESTESVGQTESGSDGTVSSSAESGPSTTGGPGTSGGPGSADATSPTSTPETSASETNGTASTSGPSTTNTTDSSDESTTTTGLTAEDSTDCVPDCNGLACGDDPDCGVSCGECNGDAECMESGEYCGLLIGWPDDLGSQGDANQDIIFGHRIDLASNAVLKSFGLLAPVNGGNARMALYDGNGSPLNLVVESAEFGIGAGVNEIDGFDTTIASGEYWIVVHLEAQTTLRRSATSAFEVAYLLRAYSQGFPTQMSGDTVATDNQYNFYIVVEDL